MVDVNVGSGDDDKEKSSSKKKKKKEKKKKKKEGKAETFSLDEEAKMDTDETEVAEMSKEIANQGELDYETRPAESLQAYMKRQVKECEELYDSMLEAVKKNSENYEELAIYMHAVYINFGQNRVGITKNIMDEYGKSKPEALKYTRKICMKAGEKEAYEDMINYVTKELVEGL